MARHRRTATVHKRPPAGPGVRNEINVTPLVDVVLVLLIIFMVVMPEMSRGVEVALPRTTNHAEKQDTGQQVVVSVKKMPGRVDRYFGTDPANTDELLREKTETYLRRKPGQTIFVKADAELTYGDVYPVLLVLDAAGSTGIELGTDDAKEP